MYEHKLHYDFGDNKIITSGKSSSSTKGFADVKILLPRNELCWNDEFKGKLRLVDTKTFHGSQPINTYNLKDEKTKFSVCQDCKQRLPFNATLKRCGFCRDKHHAKIRKEKRELKKEVFENKPDKNHSLKCIDCKKFIKFDLRYERCLRCRNKHQAKLNVEGKGQDGSLPITVATELAKK